MNKHILLAKIYNNAFKNKFNEFIYLTILSTIFTSFLFIFRKQFWDMFIFLEIISLILCITTKRLSNVAIYSQITKHLSMNIYDLKNNKPYKNLDYENDKKILSEIFKDEFIEAILNASEKNFKTIKLSTHKWIYENVLLDKRIQEKYNVQAVQKGMCRITLEVLLLSNKFVYEAYRKRIAYKVVLKLISVKA